MAGRRAHLRLAAIRRGRDHGALLRAVPVSLPADASSPGSRTAGGRGPAGRAAFRGGLPHRWQVAPPSRAHRVAAGRCRHAVVSRPRHPRTRVHARGRAGGRDAAVPATAAARLGVVLGGRDRRARHRAARAGGAASAAVGRSRPVAARSPWPRGRAALDAHALLRVAGRQPHRVAPRSAGLLRAHRADDARADDRRARAVRHAPPRQGCAVDGSRALCPPAVGRVGAVLRRDRFGHHHQLPAGAGHPDADRLRHRSSPRSVPRSVFVPIAMLLVATIAAEQWGSPAQAAARLDAARPTMAAPAGVPLRDLAARAERVACTDELACLLLAGRVDRWLALDDFLRTRFIVSQERPRGRRLCRTAGRPHAARAVRGRRRRAGARHRAGDRCLQGAAGRAVGAVSRTRAGRDPVRHTNRVGGFADARARDPAARTVSAADR